MYAVTVPEGKEREQDVWLEDISSKDLRQKEQRDMIYGGGRKKELKIQLLGYIYHFKFVPVWFNM
jgi:hypothetical protein